MSKLGDESIWHSALRPLSIARMLWKQKLTIAAVSLLSLAASAFLILRLPAVYRAETVILVDSQTIPEKFVSATVSANLGEQLATLSHEILTSSRLLKIIETFDLYPEERRSLPIDDVLAKMRTDLQIHVEKGWSDERPGAFRVSLDGNDPVVVSKVVNQLGNLFVDENLRSREKHAEGTEQFIQSQLDQAKKTLDEQEKRVSEYKLEHNGELPEQEEELTASLSQLSVQLQGNQEGLNRAYASEATLKGGLDLAEAVADASKRLATKPDNTGTTDSQSSTSNPQKPEEIRKAMEAELASLLTKYTASYPRVQLLRASIARLRALEEKEQLSSAVQPQHTEGIKVQLATVNREIKERTQENQRLLQEIHTTQLHLSRIPIREQEMASLTRDYEMSKTNYKSLLDKLYAANMAADMERRQKAERFTILEPARVSQKPVKSNRAVLAGIGGIFSLFSGLLVGLLREVQKNRILGEWELPAETPVYARVPFLASASATPGGVRVRITTQGPLDSIVRSVMNGRNHDGHHAEVHPLSQRDASLADELGALPGMAGANGGGPALGTATGCVVRSVVPASPVLCLHTPDGPALEQYRIARTKVEYDRREPRLVVVSSACAGDGKTISSINLATVFAMRDDVQILLVEADFRHSCVAELLGIPPRPGLAEVLSGKCSLSEAIVRVEQLPNLFVLPAGACMQNVTEMLDTPAWSSLCGSVREQFTYVVFDAPPIGPVADYELIEKKCDGVIMVVRPDYTDRTLFRIGHGLVSPDRMLGFLVNDVGEWFLWRTSASYYGYRPNQS